MSQGPIICNLTTLIDGSIPIAFTFYLLVVLVNVMLDPRSLNLYLDNFLESDSKGSLSF